MTSLLAVLTIPHDSGLARDAVSNTFSFATLAAPTPADLTAIENALKDFYNGSSGAQPTIAENLASCLNNIGVKLRIYNRADPKPRVPIHDVTFNLNAFGADSLPSECAVVASFSGAPVAGIRAARQRGRVYIGPCRVASSTGASPGARPSAGMTGAVLQAMIRLFNFSAGSATTDWVVHSSTQVPPMDTIVSKGFVDNSWDTQRRRGERPTAKTLWP